MGESTQVYFSLTQSALSKCSRDWFNTITSTQLPWEPPTFAGQGPWTGCSSEDAASPLLIRPPGQPPPSPPSHWQSSAYSISKALALFRLLLSKDRCAPGKQHVADHMGSPGEMQARRQLPKQSSPPSVPGHQGSLTWAKEQVVPIWAPQAWHTARQAMPDTGYTPSMHCRALEAPTPTEHTHAWRFLVNEQAHWD